MKGGTEPGGPGLNLGGRWSVRSGAGETDQRRTLNEKAKKEKITLNKQVFHEWEKTCKPENAGKQKKNCSSGEKKKTKFLLGCRQKKLGTENPAKIGKKRKNSWNSRRMKKGGGFSWRDVRGSGKINGRRKDHFKTGKRTKKQCQSRGGPPTIRNDKKAGSSRTERLGSPLKRRTQGIKGGILTQQGGVPERIRQGLGKGRGPSPNEKVSPPPSIIVSPRITSKLRRMQGMEVTKMGGWERGAIIG